METHAITGDWQLPYISKKAWDVCGQICKDAKPKSLTLNGDIIDCRKLAIKFPTDDGAASILLSTMQEELERAKSYLLPFIKVVAAKEVYLNQGNHEWRIWRAMAQSPQTLQLLGIKTVRESLSVISLLDLERFRVRTPGEYPNGRWLLNNDDPAHNVWIEHGYITRKHGGYTAVSLVDDRKTSVVCGHVERAALIWRNAVGGRTYFGCEGGTLSCIGIVGEGENIYTGVPHSVPDYMNHHQGFCLIHTDGKNFWPELIRIHDGKAWWNGRLYKG